jgi:hypothetical protein
MGRSTYRDLRSRSRASSELLIVESSEQLPEGTWVTIREAAKEKGYHPTTIRLKYFKGQCSGARVRNGPLLVRLEEVK